MVEVGVGLPDMESLVDFGAPILKDDFLLTSSSVFEGSAFQRRMKATDSVKDSRGTLLFDGVHAFLHDLGSYAGMVCFLFLHFETYTKTIDR